MVDKTLEISIKLSLYKTSTALIVTRHIDLQLDKKVLFFIF